MNTEVELYGTTIKTETVALIYVNNQFQAFSKSALNELLVALGSDKSKLKILKTFNMTFNEMVQVCNTGIRMIEDAS